MTTEIEKPGVEHRSGGKGRGENSEVLLGLPAGCSLDYV